MQACLLRRHGQVAAWSADLCGCGWDAHATTAPAAADLKLFGFTAAAAGRTLPSKQCLLHFPAATLQCGNDRQHSCASALSSCSSGVVRAPKRRAHINMLQQSAGRAAAPERRWQLLWPHERLLRALSDPPCQAHVSPPALVPAVRISWPAPANFHCAAVCRRAACACPVAQFDTSTLMRSGRNVYNGGRFRDVQGMYPAAALSPGAGGPCGASSLAPTAGLPQTAQHSRGRGVVLLERKQEASGDECAPGNTLCSCRTWYGKLCCTHLFYRHAHVAARLQDVAAAHG